METKLLTTQEAARRLCVSKAFLERDRCYGPDVPFIRVGSRTVRYDPADLDAYISKKRGTKVDTTATQSE